MDTIKITSKTINKFFKLGLMQASEVFDNTKDIACNQYFIFKLGQQSVLGRFDRTQDSFICVRSKDFVFQGIRPKDVLQTSAFDALKHLNVIAILGGAGTGKTTVTLAYAIHQLFKNEKRIVLCKSTAFVGGKSNAIAAIPGDHREKLAGYVDSYIYAFRKILGDHAEHFLYEWEEKGLVEYKPIELLRGMHFDDSIVILDEAQNTSPHELLTLMSRISDTSKLIIMGDPLQIDTGTRFSECGLGSLVQSQAFFDSNVSAVIELKAQYRGILADLAIDILEEIKTKEDENDIFEEPKFS